ncbi:hypothetical protein C8Q80DRAFT_761920 [Daedaleopsis nitida]|nr:hypothetical protein C8Q80DRAFT_761920 [Daedaleopsis nitida]
MMHTSHADCLASIPAQVQAPKAGAGRKPATAPCGANNSASKTQEIPRFESRPKKFGIGQDIEAKQDLIRFVKWIRLQHQTIILSQGLNQCYRAVLAHARQDTATHLCKLLNKYRRDEAEEDGSPRRRDC